MYYTYMLRCEDNSIYTGITTNLERRFAQHKGIVAGGAKYTKSRQPLKIEVAWKSDNKSLASKLEYRLKRLSKADKENLVMQPELLQELLCEKLDARPYILVEVIDMIKKKILELKDKKWDFLGEVNPDMSLGVFGLFLGKDSDNLQYILNGTFDEFDESGVCLNQVIDLSFGKEAYTFDGDTEILDFVYKQLHSSSDFDKFRYEYEKLQYEGVTSYLLDYVKDHEFLLLEKGEVEAEDGIALEFNGMLDSGLFVSGLIYEIEDEYRNSYIDFAYDDYLYISLDDNNFFAEDPYLKDYIVSVLDNVDFTC